VTLAALPGMTASCVVAVNLHSPGDILNFALRWNLVSVGYVLDPGIVNEKAREAGFSRLAQPILVVIQTRRGRPV
jgi:hypothetical protein